MPRFATFHDGTRFKAETNPLRGSFFVTCKVSGRWLYVSGADSQRLWQALHDGWSKFGSNADGDDVWQWIWLNCGFYRLAEAA